MQLTHTEERIKQAIEEVWQELLQEADAENYSLEEYFEDYRKYWDDPCFPNDIPELIMRTVEKIVEDRYRGTANWFEILRASLANTRSL